MRAVDRDATTRLRVPGLILMENAGRGVADIVARERPRLQGLAVRVVCGSGSNGGDGFVAARHLRNRGADVRVLLALPTSKIIGDSATFLSILQAMGDIPIEDLSARDDAAAWDAALGGAAVVVDALFGTGFHGSPAGVPAAAIGGMNRAAALRVAVDLPSGMEADTGAARGAVVNADLTATMGARKLGLVIDPDAPVGRLEVVDLGVAIEATAVMGPFVHWIDREAAFGRLPARAPSSHKGASGHLLLVAGSAGRTGAALLASRAALRAGAGLCTVASTGAGQTALDAKVVETMTAAFCDGDDAGADAYDRIAALATRMQAVAIGPGIPTGPGMGAVVERAAADLDRPMVLDADALNLLGRSAGALLRAARAPRVLTPHPGEMARLSGRSTAEVQADRLGVARALAAETGAVVVLKGARTVVAEPDGTAYVNPAVNPALATAGSGDVLTGVVGALLARGVGPVDAAIAAVFLHGLAGEAAAARLGGGNLLAGDLPEAIAEVMAKGR